MFNLRFIGRIISRLRNKKKSYPRYSVSLVYAKGEKLKLVCFTVYCINESAAIGSVIQSNNYMDEGYSVILKNVIKID